MSTVCTSRPVRCLSPLNLILTIKKARITIQRKQESGHSRHLARILLLLFNGVGKGSPFMQAEASG